ncbi:Hypothetical predicted protein [Marmota monax]|uniref:non-specific serine/threonine protein kinase n=1 Tax=Marmota monax TaxID=9995 RepID=A0A5E4B334_MARMO|nr:hypothetical protein GHT09_011738 [Marmota monax]VTJ63560.1 Hypothetical predicted protein [Marmota monax]
MEHRNVIKLFQVIETMDNVYLVMEHKGFAHLDLKPQNFAVDARGRYLKLIDFGLSMSFMPGQKLKEFQGTLPVLPPKS